MARKILLWVIVILVIIASIFLLNKYNVFSKSEPSSNVVLNVEQNNSEITEQPSKDFIGYGCPSEINRDYFYGVKSVNARSFYTQLKASEEWFLNSQGNISGYFSKGSSEGQNPDYMYSNPNMIYERAEKLDENGLIVREKWNIKIIYNSTSCESLGYLLSDLTKVEDQYRCWQAECYEYFKCQLVSLKCSKL